MTNEKQSGDLGKKLLLALLPLLLMSSCTEMGLRLFAEHYDLMEMTGRTEKPTDHPMKSWAVVDAFCAYRSRPGLVDDGWSGIVKRVNKHGQISTPDIDVDKPAGRTRIAFLGGSSTAGTGWPLSDETTWPWVTTETLRAAGKDVDFINGAQGGYTTFESYGLLWSRLRFFKPDVVVVSHGWNDMKLWKHVDNMANYRIMPHGGWSFDIPTKPVPYLLPKPIDPYIAWSQILVRIRLRIAPPVQGELSTSAMPTPGESDDLVDYYHEGGLDLYRTNLTLLRDTCKQLGIRLVVIKQPTLISPQTTPEDRERIYYSYHGFDHDTHVVAYDEIYQIIDEAIPAANVLDLTRLNGWSEGFADGVHPTVEGAKKIGELVADFLIDDIP